MIPALGAQRTQPATQALLGCLKDPSGGIRMQAMRALEGCATPEVIEQIRRVGLAEKDDEIRTLAAQVLRAMKVDDEVLLDRLENDPNAEAAAAASSGPQLEMANQALKVVVFSGDGDLVSIGGNHFIHAARRGTRRGPRSAARRSGAHGRRAPQVPARDL